MSEHHRFAWKLWNGSTKDPDEYRLCKASDEYARIVRRGIEWTIYMNGSVHGSAASLPLAKKLGLKMVKDAMR